MAAKTPVTGAQLAAFVSENADMIDEDSLARMYHLALAAVGRRKAEADKARLLEEAKIRAAPARETRLPSVARQIAFIEENSLLIDEKTGKQILSLVMMSVGRDRRRADDEEGGRRGTTAPVVIENNTTREISIVLTNIGNPEVILQIYNIVYNQRHRLNEPVSREEH